MGSMPEQPVRSRTPAVSRDASLRRDRTPRVATMESCPPLWVPSIRRVGHDDCNFNHGCGSGTHRLERWLSFEAPRHPLTQPVPARRLATRQRKCSPKRSPAGRGI